MNTGYSANEHEVFFLTLAAGIETKLNIKNIAPSYDKSRYYYSAEYKYGQLNDETKLDYKMLAQATVEKLFELEPSLANADSSEKIIFKFMPSAGLFKVANRLDLEIISSKDWRIGLLSGKPRLYYITLYKDGILTDFGDLWLGEKCSTNYRTSIEQLLKPIKESGCETWNELYPTIEDRMKFLLEPIADAVLDEMIDLFARVPDAASKIVKYYSVDTDYYQLSLVPREKKVKLQLYNMYGNLNTTDCPVLKFPSKIEYAGKKESSTGRIAGNMLRFIFDGGWVMTMRLHAVHKNIDESKIRFDISLGESRPYGLYQTYIGI